MDGVGEVVGEVNMDLTTGMGGGSGSLVAGVGAEGFTTTNVRTVRRVVVVEVIVVIVVVILVVVVVL